MTKSKKKSEDPVEAMKDSFFQMQQLGLSSMPWMGGDWMEKMSDMGNEVLQFVAKRVEEDVALQHKLMSAKNIQDLQKVQAEFIQTAINRYTEETGKLVEMSTEMWLPGTDKKS
jgi:phasin family protein